ncbi:kinase-like domain-containing protein [Cercophora newfieldiana]|uniref:Kinase-like domain-containing protein n=1 Tax=Cercophora newfieldiana TaxID=92897 RepID=A0AA39Y7G2_9PEZI|nr:kinase-like domain-containing protein [Cercophora newfieldiana]
METIAHRLRSRFTEIERTTHAGDSPSYRFYSRPEVEELLTADCIADCLTEFARFKTTARHDIRRYASIIRQSSMLIFAALLLDGHEAYIMEFVLRRDTDERLPYTGDDFKEYGDLELPPLVRAHFLKRQRELKPVMLGGDDIHRQIHPDDIIPIMSQTKTGAGGFGTVWKTGIYATCQRLVPQEEASHGVVVVARKQLEDGLTGANERAVLRLLQTLKHPNIIEFLGSYSYNGVCSLLFTFAAMDLGEFLLADARPPMEIRSIYAAIHGLADALCHIHNFTLHDGSNSTAIGMVGYHHDLRPANILVHRRTFVIADFGLSRLKPNDADSKTKLHGGVDDYLGPESFDYETWTNGSVGRPLDVWALGCILIELATFIEGRGIAAFRDRRKATHGTSMRSTSCAFHLDRKIHPEVVRWIDALAEEPRDPQLRDLLRVARDMLERNAFLRPKMSDIAPRLELLAVASCLNAVETWFADHASGSEPAEDSSLGASILLEHIRIGAWRSTFQSLHLASRMECAAAVLAAITQLAELLAGLDPDISATAATTMLPQQVLAGIDALCSAVPEDAQRCLLDLWSRRVCDIDDFSVLEAIRLASKPERYRVVGVAAAMKQMSVAISKSIKLGGRSRYMEANVIELDEHVPPLPFGLVRDPSKTMGYLATDEGEDDRGQRVLVEWKAYDAGWKNHANAQHQMMDNLTNLLDPDVTPRLGVASYRIPSCLGYFHNPSHFRFGFVYALPDSVVGNQNESKVYSLNNIIRMANESIAAGLPAPMPDLGDVFFLAKDLATCLLDVHQAGWLHKNLSSHHVLIFSPDPDSASQCIASSVLTGFNDSRPEVSGFTLGPRQEYAHYQHPEYVGGTNFRRAFDYYGLGILLLELGLWVTVTELRTDHSDLPTRLEFTQKLLSSYVPQLGGKVGALYRNAVRFCLDSEQMAAREGWSHGDVEAMHSLFQEKVVVPLSRCFA